jgi:hypothetical protein
VADKVEFALIANNCHRLLKQGRLPEHSALVRCTTVEPVAYREAWKKET